MRLAGQSLTTAMMTIMIVRIVMIRRRRVIAMIRHSGKHHTTQEIWAFLRVLTCDGAELLVTAVAACLRL